MTSTTASWRRSLQAPLTAMFVALMIVVGGCSLDLNDFYEFRDFEILVLGTDISDMIMDPDHPYLYLADYEDNAVLRIDVSDDMTLDRRLTIGSHPIALDITRDQRHLVVAFNGESNLKLIDLRTFRVVDTLFVSLSKINDIACATDSRIFVSSETEPNVVSVTFPGNDERVEIIRSGELLASANGAKIFTASANIIQKYDISSGVATQEAWSAPFGFQARINDIVLSPKRDQILLCLADPNDNTAVHDVVTFSTANLTYEGKFEVGSAGVGVAVTKDGKRVFGAPSEGEASGVFIVEFDGATKLEQKYYLAAGNIKARGIVVDNDDRYLYAIVNTPLDDDSLEPYNNNSFDLQRIEIR